MIYDFSINYHKFRIVKNGEKYTLFSVYTDQKKKGKKTVALERQSIEISSNNVGQLESYVKRYFADKKNSSIEEAFRGIEY